MHSRSPASYRATRRRLGCSRIASDWATAASSRPARSLAAKVHDRDAMSFTSPRRASLLVIGASLVLALQPRSADAWSIGSQLDNAGCHEPITAPALRAVRATLDTAPVLAPSRDDAATIADGLFTPPGA